MHRQLFYKLQPCQTGPAEQSDVIGNDKKASSRSAWIIKQKNGNLFYQVFIQPCEWYMPVAYQAKKNKNSVMLLHSCHADNLVVVNEKKNSDDPGLYQKKKRSGHV